MAHVRAVQRTIVGLLAVIGVWYAVVGASALLKLGEVTRRWTQLSGDPDFPADAQRRRFRSGRPVCNSPRLRFFTLLRGSQRGVGQLAEQAANSRPCRGVHDRKGRRWSMVQVVWEFIVRADAIPEFEVAYGADGAWAELFKGFPGYRGTALLRDRTNSTRYLTVDSWETLEHRAAMLAGGRDEYDRLDQSYSGLTESEVELGVFEALQPGSQPA